MRRLAIAFAGAVLAVTAVGGDLKSTLSADRPQDRAILGYLERAEAKTATAAELTDLGVLLAASGHPEDAEHWLHQAVKADKHNFAARYRLGLVQQQQGRCRDAARSFARALDERPDDAYARFMLALARERCGSPHGAVADYARAYGIMPELAEPESNPLVLDSQVQTQARLEAYRKRMAVRTFPVTAVDPAAVKAMMAARPEPTPAAPPAAPQAIPAPETVPVPQPPPVTPPPVAPPGAPGGADPRKPGLR